MPKKSTVRQARYDAQHITRIGLKLHNDLDADIIQKLKSVDSMSGYIKSLLRQDINRKNPSD